MEGTSNDVEADGGDRSSVYNNVLSNNKTHGEAPTMGMVFNTIDDLFEFYKEYARANGFGIAKRGVRKDEATRFERWQTITCTKAGNYNGRGSNILVKRSTRKCGCKARVCCAKTEGRWVVTKAVLEHNHELNPTEARFIPQHRSLEDHIRRLIEANDMAGVRPTNNIKSVVFQGGGHEEMPCLNVDLRNHIKKFRKLNLVGGDAQTVLGMFANMQNESGDFFYFMKPDKEGRLKHVFWADGRCRAAYKEFNDVITFDTTYLVNKYDMPCALFVGVNHHGQSILLGCALVNNEKCKTFIWLFETWLRCMGGKHPKAIITDQCAAIGNAVRVAFPNSRHRLCLWHIVHKFPSKFGQRKDKSDLKDAFMEAIYDSVSESDFEEKWGRMVSNFELESNDWIFQLYESRQRWVPIYVKSTFWAGMSTTQRSESMNAFFDGYLNSRTSLQKFVEQYALAVSEKIEKEVQLDFLSKQGQIPCVTRWACEEQLAKAYTSSIFKIVQKELVDSMYCDLSPFLANEDSGESVYEVSELVMGIGSKRNRVNFRVNYNVGNHDVRCNCLLFEFRGYLCSHAFKVLTSNDVDVIPDKFILHRWRKDVVRSYSLMKVESFNPSIEMTRTTALERLFYKAINLAVSDVRKFTYMEKGLFEQILTLENWTESGEVGEEDCSNDAESARGGRSEVRETPIIKDPKSVRRRGRPKIRRHIATKDKSARRRCANRRQNRPGRNSGHNNEQHVSEHQQLGTQNAHSSLEAGFRSATTLLQEVSEGRLLAYDASYFPFGQRFGQMQELHETTTVTTSTSGTNYSWLDAYHDRPHSTAPYVNSDRYNSLTHDVGFYRMQQ